MDSEDCKLEAKLARNGLFNKAAALVALVVDTPEVPTVVEGYDPTEEGKGLVEFTGGTGLALWPLIFSKDGDAPGPGFESRPGFLLLLFTVMLSVTLISVDDDLDLDLLL
jgi:hypothetical protein